VSQPTIVHSDELAWETWDTTKIPDGGRVFWKNVFSRGLTDTDSLSLGIAIVHPNDALNPHHHTASEIYFVMQGEGIMTLGNEEHTVRAGDAIFIPGDVRHGIANRSDTDIVFLYAFARDSFEQVEYHFPE
jgi:mannose-6-phosphate isomerase-like protein (cupin superfamily)